MSIEIYYFSGTGNSLHIAEELQKRLPEAELIPIVSIMEKDVIMTKGETVGFVFPIYLTTVPAPVRRFLEKLNMDTARYCFSVVTRLGTFSVANINVNRILRKKGKSLDSQFVLNMANNTPTGLRPGKGDEDWVNQIRKEKVAQFESEVQIRLDLIGKVILSKENYPPKVHFNPFLSLLERVIYLLTRSNKAQIDFYTDSTCTGCATCEKVCLSGKVHLKDNKPVWQKDVNCYYCYACFNFCPMQSILVKNKYTKKDGRYIYPGLTAADINKQKSGSFSD